MTKEPPSEETSPFNSLDWKSRVENPKPLGDVHAWEGAFGIRRWGHVLVCSLA